MLPRRRTLFWPVFLSTLIRDGLAQSENQRWSSNTATSKGWPTKKLDFSFPPLQNTQKRSLRQKHYLCIGLLIQWHSYSHFSTFLFHVEEEVTVNSGSETHGTYAPSRGGYAAWLSNFSVLPVNSKHIKLTRCFCLKYHNFWRYWHCDLPFRSGLPPSSASNWSSTELMKYTAPFTVFM